MRCAFHQLSQLYIICCTSTTCAALACAASKEEQGSLRRNRGVPGRRPLRSSSPFSRYMASSVMKTSTPDLVTAPDMLTALTLTACKHESALCRRKRYDQTGSLEEADELNSQSFHDLYSFYRDLYKKVSTEDINSFSAQYRGSEEETADLIKHFQRCNGNMSQVHFCMRSWLLVPHARPHCLLHTQHVNFMLSVGTSTEAQRCADILSYLAGVPVADVL